MADGPQASYSYSKRPLWQWILLYVVIAALVYGAIYYFVFANKNPYPQSGNNPYAAPSTNSQTTTQPSSSSPSAAQTQNVTITGTEFSFSPSTITAKVGQPLSITFKNNGTYPHNLTITDLGVKTQTIQPGSSDTITFTPSKTGSFSFKCTVDSH